MRIHVITIFPELIEGFMSAGIPRIARQKGSLIVETVDPRRFTQDNHRTVDDRPYGGGPGMIMLAEPILAALDFVESKSRPDGPAGSSEAVHRILLTPQGRRLDQARLRELATRRHLAILCGRYEGIDERVRLLKDWDEISIGDYVVSGGEVAASVLIDGVARLLPGVLGHPDSAGSDTFEHGLLKAPQYTRPRELRGLRVPDVLLSGDHEAVEKWRLEQSLRITRQRRADLLHRLQHRHEPQEPGTETPD
jgi:tRNA (guanine37-N1)-methyltransferase